MEQKKAEIIEKRLLNDKGRYYRGTARVRFEYLRFDSRFTRDPEDPDRRIVKRLKDNFANNGCLRLQPANRIPAVVDQSTFDALLAGSPSISLSTLLESQSSPPEIKCPDSVTIQCLQGCHRVEAGREFLPRKDWWWTIDFYLKGEHTYLYLASFVK